MQLIIGDKINHKVYTNMYKVVVTTMEGDADDCHELCWYAQDPEVVIERYKQFLILEGTHNDDYPKLEFFGSSVWEDIYYSEYGDSYDAVQSFTTTYFDEHGNERRVEIKDTK